MRALSRGAAAVVLATMVMTACARPDFSQSGKTATSTKPAPDLPQWSKKYEGKLVTSAGRRNFHCIGYVDAVEARYNGEVPGVTLVGWGWDSAAKKPAQNVLVTNADMVVIGAGDGGIERPDVPIAIKSVTSKATGWRATVHRNAGTVYAWVVVPKSSLCSLGKMEL